ncbi:MAG: SDR family oxidoreductase [Herbiconiux sp.]|uniref:SDR family NAD(P)-dependent oxidoreductase n=1 Tax=Herbiconiux sp. TaxID=1871186 RepID=UPI001223ECBE|nr:SDR family oxidoreductase [Herbiconiux sp.]TAJ49093.1 MAG: SDR family oxidoreductase [Herbiconiux sp.]
MSYQGLDTKVVVVTGAAQGIGAAYVRRLAQEGATVIAADRNLAGVEALAAELGEKVVPLAIDVSSAASCAELAATAMERFGRVDGLINNAAIFSTIAMHPFWEIPEKEWDAIMAVNIKGPWLVTSALLEAFKASGRASIVNIGSDAVLLGRTEYLHYIASKGAVTAMTFSMSKELGGFGVRVNTLSPGPVYTEVSRETVTEAQREAMLARQAVPRTAGPDDMTSLAAFLLSDDSGYISGQTISVNGGLVHR